LALWRILQAKMGEISVLKYILARPDQKRENLAPINQKTGNHSNVALLSLSVLLLWSSCDSVKKMAHEQPNSQSSQLDEEDLNKLEVAVSEKNACRSSIQNREFNVCLSSTSETRSSVQAIKLMPNCQFTNCAININSAKCLIFCWLY